MALSPELVALDRHIRALNDSRVERLRTDVDTSELPVDSHLSRTIASILTYDGKGAFRPQAAWEKQVAAGPYFVSYRTGGFPTDRDDRMVYVHGAATAADRQRYIEERIEPFGDEILRVWEVAA
jgi:hypothetical protein